MTRVQTLHWFFKSTTLVYDIRPDTETQGLITNQKLWQGSLLSDASCSWTFGSTLVKHKSLSVSCVVTDTAAELVYAISLNLVKSRVVVASVLSRMKTLMRYIYSVSYRWQTARRLPFHWLLISKHARSVIMLPTGESPDGDTTAFHLTPSGSYST